MIIITKDRIPDPNPEDILIVEESARTPSRINRLAPGLYYTSTNVRGVQDWILHETSFDDSDLQEQIDNLLALILANTVNIAINFKLITALEANKADKCFALTMAVAL